MKLDTQSTQRLTEWFYAYSDALYRYARFYLNNSVEAQDVVQEVFSRVAEHIQSFRSEAHIKTWIFRIARNYMIDTLRRKRSLAGMQHELNLQHESAKIDTYDAQNQLIWRKSNLPIMQHRWTFRGSTAHWKIVYTIDTDAIELRNHVVYAEIDQHHYSLKYTGSPTTLPKSVSVTVNIPGSRLQENLPMPKSGFLAANAGTGGGNGAMRNYNGNKGSFNISWNGQREHGKLTVVG